MDTPRTIRGYATYGKRRSLRLEGLDYSESHVYHITWRAYVKARNPLSEHLRTEIVRTLNDRASTLEIRVLAYCVMPDHVHVLLIPNGSASVTKFVQQVKSLTTRTYWLNGGCGKLWQRGFYDHVLRRDEDVLTTSRYIAGNPVRSGLVSDASKYPFSGPRGIP